MKNLLRFLLLALLVQSCSKDEESTPQALELECRYNSNVTLSNRNPDGVDYIARCQVEVFGGTMTVEPGTTIFFEEGASLYVASSGAIRAVGSAVEPITFTGKEWGGVGLEADGRQYLFEHCNFDQVGSGTTFGTFNQNRGTITVADGDLRMSNCILSDGRANGVVQVGEGQLTVLSNVRITGHQDFPIVIEITEVDDIDVQTCTFSNNGQNYIKVQEVLSGNELAAIRPIEAQPIPYFITNEMVVDENMTLLAGNEWVFDRGASIQFFESELTVAGQPGRPVVFRGAEAEVGFWKGIYIQGDGTEMTWKHMDISDGGSSVLDDGNLKANIKLGGFFKATLNLENVTSARSGGCDVALNNDWVDQEVNGAPASWNICQEN